MTEIIEEEYGEEILEEWVINIFNQCNDLQSLEDALQRISATLFSDKIHNGRVLILIYFCRRLTAHLKDCEWYTNECIDILLSILKKHNYNPYKYRCILI